MKVPARWWIPAAALSLMALVTGCSGINATHSVSPATFLVPGLMKVQPPKAAPTDPAAAAGRDVAAVTR